MQGRSHQFKSDMIHVGYRVLRESLAHLEQKLHKLLGLVSYYLDVVYIIKTLSKGHGKEGLTVHPLMPHSPSWIMASAFQAEIRSVQIRHGALKNKFKGYN